MNFYKHHLGDYASHTGHLSILEDGVYSRLLRRYYITEKPLPNDLKELSRLIGARSRHEVDAVERCVNSYFSLGADGLLHNSRADKEIEQYQRQVATNRRIAQERIVHEPSTKRTPNHKPLARYQIPEESKPLASSPNGLSAGVNGEGVCFIPLVDGSEFGVSEGALQEFKKAYPSLDCKQTMLEIRAWCVANPTKRKTRKGAMRFINSWMARLQDRAH